MGGFRAAVPNENPFFPNFQQPDGQVQIQPVQPAQPAAIPQVPQQPQQTQGTSQPQQAPQPSTQFQLPQGIFAGATPQQQAIMSQVFSPENIAQRQAQGQARRDQRNQAIQGFLAANPQLGGNASFLDPRIVGQGFNANLQQPFDPAAAFALAQPGGGFFSGGGQAPLGGAPAVAGGGVDTGSAAPGTAPPAGDARQQRIPAPAAPQDARAQRIPDAPGPAGATGGIPTLSGSFGFPGSPFTGQNFFNPFFGGAFGQNPFFGGFGNQLLPFLGALSGFPATQPFGQVIPNQLFNLFGGVNNG